MNVRELFRYKLENSEPIPGDSVRTELMRRLAGREFIHFNPSRFNVYYLGGIVAAGIVATLLLTSNPGARRKPEVIAPTENNFNADTVANIQNNPQQAEEQLVINKAENVNKKNGIRARRVLPYLQQRK